MSAKTFVERYQINIKKLIAIIIEMITAPILFLFLFDKNAFEFTKDFFNHFSLEQFDIKLLKFFIIKNPMFFDFHFMISFTILFINAICSRRILLMIIFIACIFISQLRYKLKSTKNLFSIKNNILIVSNIYLINGSLLC